MLPMRTDITYELDCSGRQLGSSGTSFRMLLKDLFFQPEKVHSNPEMIDELAEGMLRQTGHKWDNKFVDDITNHLFEVNGKGGLDLIALNTQRGRDHGLPGVDTSNSRFSHRLILTP